MDSISKITLLGFSDASEKGYAGVIYLLTSNNELRLLTSKSKVAQLKRAILARLELCAALVLSKLLTWCCKLFDRSVEIHAFSDSQIVLSWLQSH